MLGELSTVATHFIKAYRVLQGWRGVQVLGDLDVVVDCSHGDKSRTEK